LEPLKSARAIQPNINRLPRNKNEGHEKDKTKGSKRTKRRAQKEETKDNYRSTARQYIRLSIHDFLQNMDVHYSTSSLRHTNPTETISLAMSLSKTIAPPQRRRRRGGVTRSGTNKTPTFHV